jgi:hypothetical protein
MSAEEGSVRASVRRARPVTDGCSQRDRFPEPLREGYFAPNELELEDLITYMARVAGNLRFDPPPGAGFATPPASSGGRSDWSDLFTDEPLVTLAEIASLKVPAERARLLRLRDPAASARVVNHLGEQLLHWRRTLDRRATLELEGVRRALDDAVDELADVWAVPVNAGRKARSEAGAEARPDARPEAAFVPAWSAFAGLQRGGPEVVAVPKSEGAAPQREGAELEHLTNAGDRVLGMIAPLQEECRSLLERLLHGGRTEPALALLISFLRLAGLARDRMNAFPRRRLEFYYLDVLGFSPLPRIPDHAWVSLAPAPGIREVVVPAATRFGAGRGPENRDVVFRSDREMRITDARVASLCGLVLERDPLVSPERELGYASALSTRRVEPAAGVEVKGDASRAGGAGARALFDAVDGVAPGAAAAAEVGFAVASPALLLGGGERTIEISFDLRRPSAPDTAPERSTPFQRVGEVFALELMSTEPPPPGEARRRREVLERALAQLAPEDPAAEVLRDLFRRDRHAVFRDLFRRALQVEVTSESGWRVVPAPFVGALNEGSGFRVVLELGPGDGPVVPLDPELHGDRYATQLPVARFRINADAPFFPYSLLRALELARVNITTTVEGLTDLVAYNRVGPLDASRPFQPFGPMPDLESMVAIGCHEAARKRLREAWLEIEWGGLPTDVGGWATHYRGYEGDYTGDPFVVDVAVARDRGWYPATESDRPRRVLFSRDAEGRLEKRIRLDLPVLAHFEPLDPSVGEAEYRRDPRLRNGVFRMSLRPSAVDFGHAAYPRLLTRAVQKNARRRRPEPEPRAPWTPTIDRISFNYVARSTIRLDGEGADGAEGVVFHDHPFGSFDLRTARSDERYALLPGTPGAPGPVAEGAPEPGAFLFVGLSATTPGGRLDLLFDVSAGGVDRESGTGPLEWYYLASNRWRRLSPVQVVDDSTGGMQRTGVVTLDVPTDIDGENTILPPGLHWLAVGGDRLGPAIPRIRSVSTGGLRVVWDPEGSDRVNPGIPIPAGTIASPLDRVPGLGSVVQVAPSTGGRPAEDFERLATRVSERLRHKNRAVTPWDHERIVLERFPAVSKVKCFPNTDIRTWPEPAPGTITLVVVPRLLGPPRQGWRPRGFSPLELEEMAREICSVASAAARIEVVNPAWESVLVRCRIKLLDGAQRGRDLDEIDRALIEHLAPWNPDGLGGRFGWSVREREVAALLYAMPSVEFVTEVSLLHVSEDKDVPGAHFRNDTARTFEPTALPHLSDDVRRRRERVSEGAAEARHDDFDQEVSGRYPWSLAVPRPSHVVEASEEVAPVEPRITGFGKLEVGSDFILEPHDD